MPPRRKLPPDIAAIIARTVRAAEGNPDPLTAARSITRATTIVGLMLEDLSDEKKFKPGQKFASWVTRIGQIGWGVVELAAPRSLGEVLFQYWIWLLYTVAALVLIMGGVTGGTGVTRAGGLLAAFTLGAHLLVGAVRQWLHRRHWLYGVAVPVLILSTVGLGYFGTRIRTAEAGISGPRDWGRTGLMGQLGTAEEAGRLLGPATGSNGRISANWDAARQSLAADWGFIPSYVGWLLAAALLAGSVVPWPRRHVAIGMVAVLTVLAALADVNENVRAWLVLHQAPNLLHLPYSTSAKLGFAAAALLVVLAMAGIAGIYELRRRVRRYGGGKRNRAARAAAG